MTVRRPEAVNAGRMMASIVDRNVDIDGRTQVLFPTSHAKKSATTVATSGPAHAASSTLGGSVRKSGESFLHFGRPASRIF